MTAVAGLVAPHDSPRSIEVCEAMLGALPRFGDSGSLQIRHFDRAAFGCALSQRVPEDAFDRQPLTAGDRYLLVADVRLDNRDDLIRAIYPDLADARQLADADILLAAWHKWQRSSLDWIAGDYAFALFDRADRSLTLARDPAGQRPLFYARAHDVWLFASMPSGVLASGLISADFDQQSLARKLLGFSDLTEATWLSEVKRVPAASLVCITDGGIERKVHWQPPADRLELSDDDFVEAYDDALEQAVRSRMRRSYGRLAVHLSSGFDSSAVTAMAARLGKDSPPIAFTSAPRLGFDGPVPAQRIADESELAAKTAAMYGLEHHIVRSSGHPLALLKRQSRTYQEPDRNVINMDWWNGTMHAARAHGATVLLSGIMGNLTLNWGGLPVLSEWMRQRGPIVWFHEAKQVREKLGARWRGMLFHTFGDYLPLPAVALLSRISQKLPSVREAAFVRSHWLDHSRDFALEERKCFPKDNLNVMRLATIHSQNQALFNLAGLHETGVDERDPTTDRRLMEFSFRLPPAQLLKDGVSRPLMRRALAHRLPDAILSNPLRGLQGADWYEQLRPGEIHDILDEVAASAGVNAVLDLQQIRTAVNHWPAGGWDKPRIVAIYRRSLPLALSTAVFIHEFEQLIRRRELDRIFSS